MLFQVQLEDLGMRGSSFKRPLCPVELESPEEFDQEAVAGVPL